MPCRICGADVELDEDGLCAECAQKAGEASSALGDTIEVTLEKVEVSTETLAAPSETSGDEQPTSRKVLEIGQEGGVTLRNPFSVALDDEDNLFVMDQPERGSYRVTVFAPDGSYLRTVVECEQGEGADELKYPKGVALDPHGNLYIPDAGNNRIQRFDEVGSPMGPLGTAGEGPGQFSFPCDVDIDEAGVIYVADTYNCRIQKLTPQGVLLVSIGEETVAKSGSGSPLVVLDEPLAVTVDIDGNIFVADTNNHRLLKFDADGAPLLELGEAGEGPRQFSYPSDVRVQTDGTIYVADMDNSRVQKFDPGGGALGQFALQMEEMGVGGGDIAVDSEGGVWMCDYLKHTVARVELFESPAAASGETE
ncbi:MAG: NHL repeat-containing protein [Candidatus Brocadiia bacterium]